MCIRDSSSPFAGCVVVAADSPLDVVDIAVVATPPRGGPRSTGIDVDVVRRIANWKTMLQIVTRDFFGSIMSSSASRTRSRSPAAVLTLALLCLCPPVVTGAVHEYASASFYPTTNGAILLGGREGVYASRVDLERTTTKGGWIAANPRVRDGKAYVRLDELVFTRDESTANAAGATSGADGLVEAALFERNDFCLLYTSPSPRD